MKSRIIYTTSDGIDFDNSYDAKKHECKLTAHKWEYYNSNLGLQKEQTEDSKMRFCKYCSSQEFLTK